MGRPDRFDAGSRSPRGRRAGTTLFAAVCVVAAAAGCGGSSKSTTESVASGDASSGASAATSGGAKIAVPTSGTMVDTAKYKKDGPWTIGYADSSMSNSWRVFAWQYMQWEASKYPVKLIHSNANDSIPKQISDVENLVARKVDCLIVSATSDKALDPVIGQASKQVPVVIQERSVQTNDYVSFASLDAVKMGELQAQSVADTLHGEGNVIILEGIAGSGPVVQSLQGMKQVLAKYPKIKILATQYTDWSPDKGKTVMEDALQSFPKIDAVLSDSGLQNTGAFEAVKAAGRLDQVKAWTGDSVQSWMRIVKTNNLPGVVVDRPTKVAQTSVAACIAILQGQPVPKVWQTENQVVTPAALAKYIAPASPGSDQWWDWWDLPKQWLPKA
jgi:ribose transport system substrate-binding protein